MLTRKQVLFKSISASENIVAARVNDLAGYIERQLKGNYEHLMTYSAAIVGNQNVRFVAYIAVCIRGGNEDLHSVVKFL
jgi:hypothetical protein